MPKRKLYFSDKHPGMMTFEAGDSVEFVEIIPASEYEAAQAECNHLRETLTGRPSKELYAATIKECEALKDEIVRLTKLGEEQHVRAKDTEESKTGGKNVID